MSTSRKSKTLQLTGFGGYDKMKCVETAVESPKDDEVRKMRPILSLKIYRVCVARIELESHRFVFVGLPRTCYFPLLPKVAKH